MYCPNCGKDCGSAKFCTGCGTKLEENIAQSAARAAEQRCPHCGGTQMDGDKCAFCGALLVTTQNADPPQAENADSSQTENAASSQTDCLEIPYRTFELPEGKVDMHLAKEFVTLTKKGLFTRNVTKILYSQLDEIVFSNDHFTRGTITFRWHDDSTSSQNAFALEVGKDRRAAYYYHIFHIFRVLAPQAKLETNFSPIEESWIRKYSADIDLDAYFDRFNPHREKARDAIIREYALQEFEAKRLVGALFNKKQSERYASDPLLAVIDYNHMVQEQHRVYEEEVREIDENRSHWRS